MSEKTKQPDLIAYLVTESGEKSFFSAIGAAWQNAKGGYNLRLNATPVEGKVVLLPPREAGEGKAEA